MMSTTPGIKVEGTFSGIVTYSDGNRLSFDARDISIERYKGTLRIVAYIGGAIILEFKDVPGETVSVPVSRAEVEHKDFPYAVGYEGTVEKLLNAPDRLKSPNFSASLKGRDNKDVTFTGSFDIKLSAR